MKNKNDGIVITFTLAGEKYTVEVNIDDESMFPNAWQILKETTETTLFLEMIDHLRRRINK